MHQKFWTATCALIAFAAAASLVAQTTSSSTAQSTSSTGKVTVTGCIQRAQPAGSPEATASTDAKFILTNATASGSTSTTGTSGTPSASSSAASTYRLDTEESKLSPHVGHKVSITGTVESASKASSSSTTPSSASSSSSANAPKLKVDSVTMVSSTCP